MMKRFLFLIKLFSIAFILCCLISCAPKNTDPGFSEIEIGFVKPPDSIQTSVYWYWLSDNISKEGVVKDLEAMKAVGINRAFIGHIGLEDIPYGKVKLFSDEWWDILHTALKRAGELGIEIGLFNSPGWSQSGGPWVKPNQAMRYLASSETVVKGPQKVTQQLERPTGDFQDVQVIAFSAPKDYTRTLAALSPKLSAVPTIPALSHLMDTNKETEVSLPAQQAVQINLSTPEDFTARSLTLYPAKRNMQLDVKLEALVNGDYKEIKQFKVDRKNNELNVGFEPYAPVIVSFDAVSTTNFRLTIANASSEAGIAELEISAIPKVERFKEKTLAKMHPTPLPYWHDYQWEPQVEVKDSAYLIPKSAVLDITDKMNADGTLNWEVPAGEWVVLRTGMLPTGVKNGPASPEGTGLEIDKINHEHVIKHFDAFMGEILQRIPAEDRKTFKVAVQDSYEMGGQNWTDDFLAKFEKQFGYNPKSYVPVMYGHVVGSQEESDRFLWDLRRFVADQVAYEYVGGLRDVSHQHGLTIWLENYGHWGFPGEFLQYGGQSDEIGGEFWSEGELGDIENRAASSAAHIYGKTKVSAESFTAAGNTFGRYPAMMKQRGDRFFTEGINNTLLHVYIQQPYEDKKPGVNAWFGNEFNRFNTWFYDMDMFVAYLKRCNFMLQQGKYVADVAYFIGEDAPKMTGVQDPALPKGYSFDYINGEVIRERLDVKNGQLVLPDGMAYRLLVLPQLETIRPELLKKISDLVKRGGAILGPRPKRSPSLQHFGEADRGVQKMADELWGNIDGKNVKEHKVGKGLVMQGLSMQEALDKMHVLPDLATAEKDPILFIHRTLQEGEIYFVSNQEDQPISVSPHFRVGGKSPELWNATTGKMRDLEEYTTTDSTIAIPLKLAAYESAFIIFRKNMTNEKEEINRLNFPDAISRTALTSPWEVRFDSISGGPGKLVVFEKLTDWSQHENPLIKYYSGTAYYSTSFSLDSTFNQQEKVWLDLGNVVALAKVKVNGKDLGGVWTPPYKVDITEVLQQGDNRLEIKVVNTWRNRLVGDQQLPESERRTWTLVNPYTPEDKPTTSGLLGPVVIETYPY